MDADNIADVQIWGNGARFDIGILEDAYGACFLKTPWNFRKEMDVKTLVAFKPEIKDYIIKNNNFIPHYPIDDCKTQIQYCCNIWQNIMIK